MSNEQKKIYAGNGKRNKAGGINISINLTRLANEAKEYIKESNGNKYISLTIWENKEKDKYDNTHNVVVNTWKPEEVQAQPQQSNTPAPSMAEKTFTNEKAGDLPF